MPFLGIAGFGGGLSSRLIGLLPGYIVSTSAASVDEGSSVTFTVTTANVPDATTLYWSLNTVSGTVNSSDFTGAAVTGNFTITSGSGSVALTLANDNTTEGSESFQLQVRTGSTSGTIVATSSTVTIGDTSLSVPVSYVVVGGGGGASYNTSNGLGGDVLSGTTTIPKGSYSITIGSGGAGTSSNFGTGGAGSSSSFHSFGAIGSARTSTVSVDGETFSGIDGGSTGGSTIKGSGASSSVVGPVGCSDGTSAEEYRCSLRGHSYVQRGGSGNNGVCIITIATIHISKISTSGADISTSGSNTIYRFNSSGSLVVS